MKILILVMIVFGIGCMNKVEVPNKVEQCFKDPKTGECTNQAEVIVRHIISIELPAVFTDECKAKWNDRDYPDPVVRAAGYNQCIAAYMNDIIKAIQGFNPASIPLPEQTN